jgi:hypothetical protein
MKIVILGAGASYDSINRFHEEDDEVLKWRPPLGNDIFGSRQNFRDIYDKYPGAKSFSHSINSGNDIEDFFQKKWDLATSKNDKYTLANIINAQYCLQELFYEISIRYSQNIGVSNYHVLMQQAYDYHLETGEEVVFITFNYDLLLEQALLEVFNEGNDITIETYTKYPIKIFKPHGSCNWFRTFNNSSLQFHRLLSDKPSLQDFTNALNEDILVSDFPLNQSSYGQIKYPYFHLGQKSDKSGDYMHCYPQLLIPIKTKDDFVMTKEHVDLMNKYLSQCTEMLIVGWKGQEQCFLNTLKEQCGDKEINATFVTCGDQTPMGELNSNIPKMKPHMFYSKYFETQYLDGGNMIQVDLKHIKGSFSSYILDITKNGKIGFFTVNNIQI